MPGIRTCAAALCAAVLAIGCSSKSNYACTGSEQCLLAGTQGVCEPQGFCSFPDTSCPGGRKFDSTAGGGLAGQCVAASDGGMPDAGGDGGVQASCIAEVIPGRHSMCVLETDHSVWCAGQNDVGELGFGVAGVPQPAFMQVRDATGTAITDATAVGGGWEFSCAVRTGGTVWCWGGGGDGQIGNNTQSDQPAAVQVLATGGAPLTDIVEVGGGYAHNCARGSTGGVWCWGKNDVGQIGDGTATRRLVATPVLTAAAGAPFTGATSLVVGGHHACVTKANNEVWCWGLNSNGELGDGTTTNRTTPVLIGTAASVGVGHMQVCTVHADGSAWCAGKAWRNRIGNGVAAYDVGPSSYKTPAQVLAAPAGAPLAGATQIVVGGQACVTVAGGAVECWGDDNHGQTGTGGGSTTPAPVLIAGGKPLTGVDRMVTKYAVMCAHRTAGDWLCWGRNLEGAFGDGTFVNHALATPVKVHCP